MKSIMRTGRRDDASICTRRCLSSLLYLIGPTSSHLGGRLRGRPLVTECCAEI